MPDRRVALLTRPVGAAPVGGGGPLETHVAVGLGEARAAGAGEVLVAYGLGSCVALCLFDPTTGVAGMAHVVLPGADPAGRPHAKFARNALPALLLQMARAGADGDARRFSARLAGGAQVLVLGGSGSLPRIGDQNAAAVREVLREARVSVEAEDLGGSTGRTVWLDPRACGQIRVRTVGGVERTL